MGSVVFEIGGGGLVGVGGAEASDRGPDVELASDDVGDEAGAVLADEWDFALGS
ncbi:hypothetical protein [Sorangium sp. So ce542]|uniref:hypothetical protein n=1 Tax=Sorangium sp. So ce542 TaxID=3133316 RepID=UPI003F620DC0